MRTQLPASRDRPPFTRSRERLRGPASPDPGATRDGSRCDLMALLARSVLVAAALLIALGPIATARAISLSDLVPSGRWQALPWAGRPRGDRPRCLVADLHSYEPDFGTAGLTVMGPLAAADGESSGMVFGWTATARDPAYLFTSLALPEGGRRHHWIAGDDPPGPAESRRRPGRQSLGLRDRRRRL